MLRAIHFLLVLMYALLPVGMLWWALVRRTRGRRVGPLISLLLLFLGGVGAGMILVILNGQLMSLTMSAGGSVMGARIFKTAPAQISYGEAARFIYFIIGALCLVRTVLHRARGPDGDRPPHSAQPRRVQRGDQPSAPACSLPRCKNGPGRLDRPEAKGKDGINDNDHPSRSRVPGNWQARF